MEKGGHIIGYKICDEKIIKEISNKVNNFEMFLVGDGNHSLAAAKNFWEKIKGTVPNLHPARYALVELVNIHDPGLSFEPIHRVVIGVEPDELLKKFNAKIIESPTCHQCYNSSVESHSIGFVTKNKFGRIILNTIGCNMEIETLDAVIDNCSIEYEHDPEIVEKIGKKQGNTVSSPTLKKEPEFFSLIIKKGILPRKSFSLGKENEKDIT